MSLKLRCPACKTVFAAGNAPPGGIVNCPGCKAAIRLPTAPSVKPGQPESPNRTTSPSPKQEGRPGQTVTTPWYWVLPFVLSGAAYEILRRAGWISEKTTKDQFKFQFLIVVLIAGAIGFAVWGIIELIRKALATPAAPPASPPSLPPPPPPSFTAAEPQTSATVGHWWLHVGGQATGPFATAAVVEAVRQGDFPSSTPACPVGGNEWKPIANWHELVMQATSNHTQSAR